ncbi:hypothetical protein N9V88_00315 [bacterium]|nr:hypothetical protein [bacterium]
MSQPNKKQFDSPFHIANNTALLTACNGFKSRCLFYPSSGQDFIEPIEKFWPFIDEFWFVDPTYRLKHSLIANHFTWTLIDTMLTTETGLTIRKNTPFKVQIRTDIYLEESTDRKIKIHSCKGLGYNAFRVAFRNTGKSLSIFLHRGDSPGEGGSDFHWLTKKMLKYLLLHVEPNGLIVTDGSNSSVFYSEESPTPFQLHNRKFQPIAKIEPRNGPTVVWQISGD